MPRLTTDASLDVRLCIDACTDCHSACLSLIGHCLRQGGDHATADDITLLEDCTELCETTADFLVRGSDLRSRLCALCAEACERCAAECDRFGDDPAMKTCGETCRRCAEACRKIR